MAWVPKKLNARHHEIMRRLICGQKQKEIARDLNIHPQAVTMIVGAPLFQSALRSLTERISAQLVGERASAGVVERIKENAGRALDVMLERMTDPAKPDLQFRASRDILDRAGYKAPEKVMTFSVSLEGKFGEDIAKALEDEAVGDNRFYKTENIDPQVSAPADIDPAEAPSAPPQEDSIVASPLDEEKVYDSLDWASILP